MGTEKGQKYTVLKDMGFIIPDEYGKALGEAPGAYTPKKAVEHLPIVKVENLEHFDIAPRKQAGKEKRRDSKQ